MKRIKYQVSTEFNIGTKENPQYKTFFADRYMFPATPENIEAVKAIAYNGEYTIEDTPMTADEARARRDKLLLETDWTQVLDAPIDADTREAYRGYRQALRDIPEQEGFPDSIVWPELPAKTKADPDPVDNAVDLLLSSATGEEETA